MLSVANVVAALINFESMTCYTSPAYLVFFGFHQTNIFFKYCILKIHVNIFTLFIRIAVAVDA